MTPVVALVGDYSASVVAHRAIPLALGLASEASGVPVRWRWVQSRAIRDPAADLASCAAVWAIPASPYESMDGVLGAIRWARETGRPFLGTCGGFQHALIEFARNVAGIAGADHAETNPGAAEAVVTPLACSLVEKSGEVRFAPDSRILKAYGQDRSTEGYHCNYGLNPGHAGVLEAAGLRFTAWDEAGAVRAAELPALPFFVATLFQPERAALRGETPPLVRAFVQSLAPA